MTRLILVTILVLQTTAALADTYNIGAGPSGEISVTNTTTAQTAIINYMDTFNAPNPYSRLDDDGDPNNYTNEVHYNGGTDPDGGTDVFGYMGVKDIKGDKVYFDYGTNGSNMDVVGVTRAGESFWYGRRAVYNLTTSTVESDILIARSQAAYDYAVSKGYNVELVQTVGYAPSYAIESFSTNVMNDGISNGGLSTDVVTDSDGNSMIRSEDDGSVHIGNASFVFNEAGVNGFTHDTMYSSLGTLQIGDGPDHRTIVEGTLEIQDPTAPNHAATKSYVDTSAALAMAMTALPKSYNGKTVLGMAGGHSGDRSAFALGLSKSQIGGNIHFNANVGYSQATSFAGAIGVGIEW